MKLLYYSFCFCFVVSILGCSTVKVNHEYDSSADFAAYQSYDWLPVSKRSLKNSHVIEKIKFVMSRQLESKGFKKVSEGPDFSIAIHGEFHGFLFYEDYVYLRDNYKPYLDRRLQDLNQYDGKLVVDFIGTETRGIIYRANVNAFMTDTTPERLDKSINEAVTGIINNFPPGQ